MELSFQAFLNTRNVPITCPHKQTKLLLFVTAKINIFSWKRIKKSRIKGWCDFGRFRLYTWNGDWTNISKYSRSDQAMSLDILTILQKILKFSRRKRYWFLEHKANMFHENSRYYWGSSNISTSRSDILQLASVCMYT